MPLLLNTFVLIPPLQLDAVGWRRVFCSDVSHLDGFKEHRGFRGRADIGYFMLTAALHYNRGEVFLLYMNVRVLQKLRVLHKFSFTARIYLFFIWREGLSEWFCSRVKRI